MVLPMSVFLTLQPIATCVDSVMLTPTVVVPPATWARAGAVTQKAPARAKMARLKRERFFFMVCFLV